ncbi:MAG: 50S ribosomal protein L15 [SAR202 cluster bacterium Io17-Chloro-G9]|nr:MAG: 50S ribosomal protein L15 [SAR202 cluster bacterium Io17-Chloro-G9]
MMEHQIAPSKGARKRRKRVGRGDSAGQGSTAGRGMKGQKSRSGGSPRPGFEGGQNPLIKGLPMKRGFNNPFKTYYSLVSLDQLNTFEGGARVTPEDLLGRQILRNLKTPVKIVGNGEITKAVTVAAHKFTRSARESIEAVGGRVEEL